MIALAMSSALAQSAPASSVQLWRLPVDSEWTLWAEDAAPAPDRAVSGRAAVSYMRDPLVYAWDDGSVDRVLRDALALDLAGAYTRGPLRFGATLPVWLLADGTGAEGGGGLGDLGAEVRGLVRNERTGPLGLAGSARVTLPSATLRAPLAARGITAELVAIADAQLGSARVSTNLGLRVQPKAALDDDGVLGDHVFGRMGLGVPLGDAGVSLDLGAQVNLAGLAAEGLPVEAIAGGWYRLHDVVIRGGVGTGLSSGIGAPTARALVAVGYEPRRVWDADGDGLVDEQDACPHEPEDVDTWRDDDGCPDPLTEVHVRVVDHDGNVVSGGVISLNGTEQPAEGEVILQLAAGRVTFHADARAYQPADATLDVADGPPQELRIVLQPDVGTLHLVVTDPAGVGIASVAHLAGLPDTDLPAGAADLTLLPGVYPITLDAPGYLPTRFPIEIVANETVPFTVVLQPRKVTVTRERLVITDKIYFEFNKSVIKPDSYGLLQEIADTLRDHPEIRRVSIEGHTDSRGSATSNLKLSAARAAAVRAWLVEHGVPEATLTSVGYGESRPVDRHETEAAYELNRRVEFLIVDRAE